MSKYFLFLFVALFIVNCSRNKKVSAQTTETLNQTIDSISVELKEISPGVWLHTSYNSFKGNPVPSNGLVVQAGDFLYLIDPAWGTANTRALLQKINHKIGLPVSRAIATHFHDDRVDGVDLLEKKGIKVYAHPKTPALAKAEGNEVPNRTFAGLQRPNTAVSFGPLEVFYPGQAHTIDNIMVWLPKQKILYGGCAVRAMNATSMGNTIDGDLDSWVKAIERSKRRYPQAEVVIPGHGAPGGIELLNHTLYLLSKVNAN